MTAIVALRPLHETCLVTMQANGSTGDRAARRAHDLAPADRSRRAEGALPAPSERLRRLSRRRQRPRPAARPAAQGLRHRHVRPSLPGQATVPELLDHRPAVPAGARPLRARRRSRWRRSGGSCRRRSWRLSTRSRRVRDLAETDSDRRSPRIACSIATTRSARRRRTRSGATSRSTRSSTTSDRSRSSTTPAASRTCRRGVIRCIGDPTERFQEDPVRMLRAVAMAARLGFTHRSADRCRDRRASRRDRPQRAGAADRGVLQAAALRGRRAGVPHAGRAPAARADRPRAAEGQRRARCGGRSPRSTPTARGSRRPPTR